MRQEETIRREILEQRIDRELEALSEKLFGKKLEDASDERTLPGFWQIVFSVLLSRLLHHMQGLLFLQKKWHLWDISEDNRLVRHRNVLASILPFRQ